MKHVKYAESIHCDCHGPVKMMDCRVLPKPVKGKILVEFDCVCVSCGKWFSTARDREYLQFAEREFCQKKGLQPTGLKKEAKTAQPLSNKRKKAAAAQELEKVHS